MFDEFTVPCGERRNLRGLHNTGPNLGIVRSSLASRRGKERGKEALTIIHSTQC